MKNKTIPKIIMTMVFIVLLPLITIEILIKNPNDIIARVKLSFQLMLFVVDLGSRKKLALTDSESKE
ncbi:MAG: hypothetical protein Q7W45_14530 [Bacteroidota bacterium]|nr:hypothetical protein [Bacteroidota bacterium]MDP3147417.1 hypothetical protein [Bacteroidota bacterium]